MSRPLDLNAAARRLAGLVAEACPGAPGAGVVVALSGGPDSVALLLAARAWATRTLETGTGAPLVAAHLNHGLRPGAADQDAVFCRDLCGRLGVPLVEGAADPRAAARERGQGLEEAARHLRRRFLLDALAGLGGPGCIATGHHRDDQVETVLMRLLRGTGPDGLRGIRPVAGAFIHPLLPWDRAAIVAFLEEQGQPWRLDATNLEGDNLRARLRREVVPVLRDVFGEGCLEGPARLAELLEADLGLLEAMSAEALAGIRDGDRLRVGALLDLPPALAARALRAWLGMPEQLEAVHVATILAWLREGTSGSGLDLPGGRRLVREFDRLSAGTEPTGTDRTMDAPTGGPEDWRPEVARVPDGGDPGPQGVGDPEDPATWRLACPASALSGNLRVRGWRQGDRMRPLGLGGSKKVSDLLREARTPAADRGGALVVTDDEGILWVVGVARDERTRLLPGSGVMVTISIIRRHSPTTRGTRN